MHRVLIVGGEGRAHALGWKIAQSPQVEKVFFAPGNGGTSEVGENVDIKVDEIEKLAETIDDIATYVSAISVINTIPAPIVDEKGNQALPGKGRLTGGVCGASIKWAGLEMVSKLDQLRKNKGYKYEIVGVGGVMTPKDFHDYRTAGADLVQSCTGAMWNPNLAAEIKATL